MDDSEFIYFITLLVLLSTQHTFEPDKMSGHIARNKTELTENYSVPVIGT